MKINVFKLIIILGICIALFGVANVKGCVNKGVNFGLDKLDQGVSAIKNSETVKKTVDDVKGTLGSAVKDATSKAVDNAKSSITDSISSSLAGIKDSLGKK